MAKNWAIAIGINQYELLPTSAHLRYAVRDAELMREFLHQTAGFPEDNILLCSDTSPAIGRVATRPSRSILRRILREELQRARGADNLWFFFAGHGMAGRNGDYFLPIDGNPNDLEDTAVSVHFVTECLRQCQAKNVVLVLDMCRNEGRTDSRDISVNVGEQTIELARQQGMITMFSCSRGERSYEIPELQQGAFTYCLVNGLKQHTILRQLEQYLIQEIPKLRQRYPYNIPIPRIIPEPGWKYDAPLLPGYATQSDVGLLIQQATNAELNEEFDQARQLWWQVVDAGTSIERSKARVALDRIRLKESRTQASSPSTGMTP
ncbi:MAG: caspase family protein, partial [Cyanobacteria bacterium J06633_2]